MLKTESSLEEPSFPPQNPQSKKLVETSLDTLLQHALDQPGNQDIVQRFLAELTAKFPVKACAKQGVAEPSPDVTRALAAKDWNAVHSLGCRHLSSNPWHLPTLLAVAEANAATDHHEAALCYLKMAQQAAPDDAGLHRQLARLLVQLRKIEEALVCWERVEELDAEDAEAARMVSRLTIEKSRRQIGLASEDNANPSATQQPSPGPRTTSGPKPHIRLGEQRSESNFAARKSEFKHTPIQELERAVRDRPAEVELYLQLVPLYLEIGRDYDAERLLTKGREFNDDSRMLYLLEDVVMLRLEKKIALAQKHLEAGDSPEAFAAAAELRGERDRVEIDIFQKRLKRDPANLAFRYELGLRLKQAGKVREAKEQFEAALADSNQKPAAAYELGECSRHFSEFPQALAQYRLAVESAVGTAHSEVKKRALYQAADLAIRIKLFKLAQRYLLELLRLDPHYKDAEDLLAITHSGAPPSVAMGHRPQ